FQSLFHLWRQRGIVPKGDETIQCRPVVVYVRSSQSEDCAGGSRSAVANERQVSWRPWPSPRMPLHPRRPCLRFGKRTSETGDGRLAKGRARAIAEAP